MIEQLSPGVEYTAKLFVCKEYEGEIHKSKPVSPSFTTEQAEGELSNPILILAVGPSSNGSHILRVSFQLKIFRLSKISRCES